MFVPQAVGTALGSLGSGVIMRWTGKYRLLNVFAQILSLLAAALILGTFNERLAKAPPFIYFFIGGTSYGAMLTITLISLISAVDHKYQAVITSASYAFRSTGSSIGITIASAVFQNLLKKLLTKRFGDLPGAADEIKRIRDSADELLNLPPGWHDGVIAAYIDALRGVWVVVLGFAILAAVASVFIKQHKLYSNLQRR